MDTYTAPLRDVRFVLEHITPLADLTATEAFAHAEPDLVFGLLEEAGRFAASAIAPTNRDGDAEGARIVDGRVVTPDGFTTAYRQYVEAGWGAIQHPAEFDGGAFPLTVANVVKEFLTSANLAFSLGPLLTTGAVYLMQHHCDQEQLDTYVPKLVSGEWAGTMNLTEPQAGSDVGAVPTKAVPAGDGTYRVTGQKIYITYGDHDLTENIIHLVLARLPDAPPGVKGISLFIVPKVLVNPDGSLGERNDVQAVSLEHKLGIHASPTCVMAFGEQGEGAVGFLVGEPNQGMRQMFTMMNDARLGVGLQGPAMAERAYQEALAYAQERRQGRGPATPPGEQAPIIEHADVRRMLLTMKANIEAARALCSLNAYALDLAHAAEDEATRTYNARLADLLTPLSKAWGTDLGVEMTSVALQVHGGMGYIEETGVAQHYRDARIAPIYEGTNGIQALDLVGRKLPMDGGAFVAGFLGDLSTEVAALPEELQAIRTPLAEALEVLGQTTRWMGEHREAMDDVAAGATPYLRLFATVVGGVLLARGAAAAQRLLDEGAAGDEARFLTAKVTIARFFATQLLPAVHGLVPAVTAGAGDLRALDADQLAP
jgi:alkylation response protein AidB-like acyl-CoA dehydrogenase